MLNCETRRYFLQHFVHRFHGCYICMYFNSNINCALKMLRRFFANFCHEIGCENDQTYIFGFVKYLSTFFYTYLPVNIHFQLIIIANFSILTDPAYFVPPPCHCGILTLRSRDFWEITLREKHVFGLFTWKTFPGHYHNKYLDINWFCHLVIVVFSLWGHVTFER
jgi:hypothetical protein